MMQVVSEFIQMDVFEKSNRILPKNQNSVDYLSKDLTYSSPTLEQKTASIIARTSNWNDSHQLIDMGIKDVFRETLDSSLRMASAALIKMGHRGYNVYRASKTFRKHDEQYLHELVAIRHDKKELLREAKQRIEDLERLLILEKEEIGKDKDLGWDTSSLIEEYGTGKDES